jgi:peptidyl-prolyl cis-trans isomerase A (cyclophilin A)
MDACNVSMTIYGRAGAFACASEKQRENFVNGAVTQPRLRRMRLTVLATVMAFAAIFCLQGCLKEPSETLVSRSLLDPQSAALNETAPATYRVRFETSKGPFTVEVTRDWAPKGADRFYNLVKNTFYDEVRFFRVIRTPRPFMAQFGINGNPAVSSKWEDAVIQDDPVKESNTRGTISFATGGPNTRTTQVFINYGDNSRLDAQGFSPFGRVMDGMEVVDQLYADYGEGPPSGRGPDQDRIEHEGNDYLSREFPKLDYIMSARIME